MWIPKFRRIVKGAALLGVFCGPAFGWSLNGTVQSENGTPLPGVKITSFNISGVSTETNSEGKFSFVDGAAQIVDVIDSGNKPGNNANPGNNDDAQALARISNAQMSVQFVGKNLTIDNVNANILKVTVINALGKVFYQQTLYQAHGSVTLDLSSHHIRGVKFIRINADGRNLSYALNHANSLMKEGDVLPFFMLSKEGYQNTNYQMMQENESDVIITMKAKANTGFSSSSVTGFSSTTVSSATSSTTTSVASFATENIKPSTVLKPGKYNRTIDGRKYIVYVPNTYDGSKPVPLLVDYHPINGSADMRSGSALYEDVTRNDAVIIIYPEGEESPMQNFMGGGYARAWNVGPCCTDADDITFSRKFIEATRKEAYIDGTRIYATGFSMGGGMSNYVACFMADIYAAVAPAAFDLAKEVVDGVGCHPVRPIPIMNFRGTNDGIVKYNGGQDETVPGKPITFLGAQNNFKTWAQINGCTDNPSKDSDGCDVYNTCNGGVKVGLCVNKGTASCNGNDHNDPCPSIAWKFLKQFTLP